MTVSTHHFYEDNQGTVADLYIASAENVVMRMAASGVFKVEVIQSLCLIALRHMIGNYSSHINFVD